VQLLKEGKEIYKSQWVFNRDGTVTSKDGAPRGRWVTKLAEGEINIEWSATAWETMWLPLGQDRTAYGESWSGGTLRAKKLR
jgi:hypothetical protein